MADSKHTPGPWHVMDDEVRWIGADDGTKYHRLRRLADMRLPNDMAADEMVANARLIAAAPRMLAALTYIRDAQYRLQLLPEDHDEVCAAIAWAVGNAHG